MDSVSDMFVSKLVFLRLVTGALSQSGFLPVEPEDSKDPTILSKPFCGDDIEAIKFPMPVMNDMLYDVFLIPMVKTIIEQKSPTMNIQHDKTYYIITDSASNLYEETNETSFILDNIVPWTKKFTGVTLYRCEVEVEPDSVQKFCKDKNFGLTLVFKQSLENLVFAAEFTRNLTITQCD